MEEIPLVQALTTYIKRVYVSVCEWEWGKNPRNESEQQITVTVAAVQELSSF